MKNNKIKPTRCPFSILRQICNLIPGHEVSKIARETGVEDKSRTFSPWSHTVSLLNAQLTHCIGLNDLCDSLQLHSGPLSTVRGATAPSRNGLSHANRERPAQMAEQLFWRVLEHLKEQTPGFAAGKRRGPAFRFKMLIHFIDSTTMELVSNCPDWAQHRRRKAAAKTHMRLNLQSLLPSFVIIDTAGQHDNKRARELCAGIKSGEVPVDGSHAVVPVPFPGGHFFSQQVNAWDSAIEALAVERTQFNLGDVEPTAMFWGVVDFKAAGQSSGFLRFESLIKGSGTVGIQIVQHQTNLGGL